MGIYNNHEVTIGFNFFEYLKKKIEQALRYRRIQVSKKELSLRSSETDKIHDDRCDSDEEKRT